MPIDDAQESVAPPTTPFPIPRLAEKRPDFRVLATSHAHHWSGIYIGSYQLAPQPDFVPVPQSNAHLIQFGLNCCCNVAMDVEGKIERCFMPPASIVIQPNGLSVSTSWDTAVSVAHIHLSPQLIITAMAEAGQGDPERAELVWRFGVHDPLIEQIGLALLNELNTTNPLGRLYAESLTQTLSLHLLRHHSVLSNLRKPPSDGLAHRQLMLVLDYINEHLATDISLGLLAGLVGLSPAYFSRRFKLSMGIPPHQYLIQCRVERAKALLMQGELTVTEVAHLVGFADHSHLTRHFKRIYGVLPGEMRRQRKNVHILGMNMQASSSSPSVE